MFQINLKDFDKDNDKKIEYNGLNKVIENQALQEDDIYDKNKMRKIGRKMRLQYTVSSKNIIEDLLYVAENKEFVRTALEVCHMINNSDRNYVSSNHGNPCINEFSKPRFLCIIDKQIHVYVIGNKKKNRTYHTIMIEGNNSIYKEQSKNELVCYIKEVLRKSYEEFMPNSYIQRIFFIPYEELTSNNKNDSAESELETFEKINANVNSKKEIQMFIFNKPLHGNMLYTAGWSVDDDIHSPILSTADTTATKILFEIMKEVN